MQFDTLLLEFEGVLADTAAPRRAALMRSLGEEGIQISDAEYERACAGFPPHDGAVAAAGLRRAPLDDTALELVALRAERYFAEMVGKGVSLRPGARAFVEEAAHRTRLAMVTRASRREVEYVLGLAGLDTAFEVIVAREDVLAPKPSPEGYEKALRRLVQRRRISRPTTSLALEDAPAGILAARAVKIPVVAVDVPQRAHGIHADAYISTLEGMSLDAVAALAQKEGR